MLKENVERFKDYNRTIEYSRLFDYNGKPTRYYLPTVTHANGIQNTLRPVTEGYSPQMTEDVINQIILESAGTDLKFSHIKPLGGKYAVRDVLFLSTKHVIADSIFEHDLPETIRDLLDYDPGNVQKDELGIGIVVMNSYSASSRIRFVPMIIRFVCTNGIVSGDTLSDKEYLVTHSLHVETNLIPAIQGVLDVIDKQVAKLKDISYREMRLSELEEKLSIAGDFGVPKSFLKIIYKEYAQRKTYDKMITTWAFFNLLTYALERKEMPPLSRVKAIDALYKNILAA